MSAPDAEYQPTDVGAELPAGTDTTQDDYKSRTGQSHISVVSDSANIEDPIDPKTADSDEQLGMFASPISDLMLTMIQSRMTLTPSTKATSFRAERVVLRRPVATESPATRRGFLQTMEQVLSLVDQIRWCMDICAALDICSFYAIRRLNLNVLNH